MSPQNLHFKGVTHTTMLVYTLLKELIVCSIACLLACLFVCLFGGRVWCSWPWKQSVGELIVDRSSPALEYWDYGPAFLHWLTVDCLTAFFVSMQRPWSHCEPLRKVGLLTSFVFSRPYHPLLLFIRYLPQVIFLLLLWCLCFMI